MTDVGFIVAGWGVIMGGLALYAGLLVRRLQHARDESLRIRRDADAALHGTPDAAESPDLPGARDGA